MIRLTSPFPESVTVKAGKTRPRRIIGVAYLAVPEEIIHAAEMLPFRVSGDNEPLPMELAEASSFPTTAPCCAASGSKSSKTSTPSWTAW